MSAMTNCHEADYDQLPTDSNLPSGEFNGGSDVSRSTARSIMTHGWLQVLAGCLGCAILTAVSPGGRTTPAIGVLHRCSGQLAPLAPFACESVARMGLPTRLRVAQFLGPCQAALSGASGNAYDPSFTCSMTNSDYHWNLAVSIMVNFAAFIVPAALIILFGAWRDSAPHESEAWWQKRASWVVTAVEIGAFVQVLCATILAPHESIIDPFLLDSNTPHYPTTSIFNGTSGGAVSTFNSSLCPYAVQGNLALAGMLND
eukprot:CAMPEP_0117605274 /NCGR_PEP_ID=MMETSP0784-20121206/79111_1 /TAXON_ID=39447 /ORGANISM="" /LENGTH=257 /DNA_ID=CAMNT_0005408317 /DNA_START=50 /DNA_END=824 /DNA_ORIENTATION=+